MALNTQTPPIGQQFAQNLRDLLGNQHSLTSLSRDLSIHRNQLHRFATGESYPKPDTLLRICQFFAVDARILTHPLRDLRRANDAVLPQHLSAAFTPVSQELFPDGFYEEWRELSDCNMQYVCQIYLVKTIDGMRHTKANIHDLFATSNGAPRELDGQIRLRGIALHHEAGLWIIERPDHNASLTFTTLKFGSFGYPGLFSGHKRPVHGGVGSGLVKKSATVMRRLGGGYREAMQLRRQPRYHTAEQTPEFIQWLLKEQQAAQRFE